MPSNQPPVDISALKKATQGTDYLSFDNAYVNKNAYLIEKWASIIESPNAPKIKGDRDKAVLANLLENAYAEAKNINSSSILKTKAYESELNASVAASAKIPVLLGLIRQVFPRLISGEICSTQPLDRPTGKVFRLKMNRDDGSDTGDINTSPWSNYVSYANNSAEAANIIPGTSPAFNPVLATQGHGMQLSITGDDVSVGVPKKLLLDASFELEQDLMAYTGLSAGDELLIAGKDEIAREIDGDIINTIRNAAIASYNITWGLNNPGGYTYTEYKQTLATAILHGAANIFQYRNAEPNWIICGTNAALHLQDLSSYRVPMFDDNQSSQFTSAMNVFGSVENSYVIYKSRYLPVNEMIIGRKGASFLDSGAFFLPYILLYITAKFQDPYTQKWAQSLQSRYTTYITYNNWFSRINIDPNASGPGYTG